MLRVAARLKTLCRQQPLKYDAYRTIGEDKKVSAEKITTAHDEGESGIWIIV